MLGATESDRDEASSSGAVMASGLVIGEGREHYASGSAREGAPPPALPAEQALQVLPRSDQ